MKKIALSIMLVVGILSSTFAQSNVVNIYIADYPDDITVCRDDNITFYVHAEDDCNFTFIRNGQPVYTTPLIINTNYGLDFHIDYIGCEVAEHSFDIKYDQSLPNSFTHVTWKDVEETVTLSAVRYDSTDYYHYKWIRGTDTISTNRFIHVNDADTYTCMIYNGCGPIMRTFVVRDMVEIYRATVDLETNLNKVTWQTDESQAEYISQVKVYRDGFFVGTAPYENGYFLDAIGSDNAARNYQIVGVTPEGVESPASYQKGTIHTTYYLDVNDNLNMTWNIPYVEQGAEGTLTYFQICKYDPITEQLTVVDQVNSTITDYTCGMNQFDGGYPVIAAVFSDDRNRDLEELSFSNMGIDIPSQSPEITITLLPGWTWISYPKAVSMDIASALGDFVPMEGDCIKSQFGTAGYWDGQWVGSLQQFTPGFGYMYYSSRIEPVTLMFGESTSRPMRKNGVKE